MIHASSAPTRSHSSIRAGHAPEHRFTRASWAVLILSIFWAGLGIIYFVSLLSLPSDGWRLTGLSSSDTKPFVYDLHLTGEPTPLRSGDVLLSIEGQPIADIMGNWLKGRP